jgi:cytochrome c biogenesis protein CcmG/thiol:disulfide interchange protein DsbE
MWKYLIPAFVLAILGVFFYQGLYLNPGQIESPLIGKSAPAFSLPDLKQPSEQVTNESFADQYSLLNVWATWCVECRHEHGYLMELADNGMPIYSINWKDERAAALEWLAVLGDPYVETGADEIGDVAIDYGVYGAPETFLIGPDQTILVKHIGPLNPAIWNAKFAPLLESDRGER